MFFVLLCFALEEKHACSSYTINVFHKCVPKHWAYVLSCSKSYFQQMRRGRLSTRRREQIGCTLPIIACGSPSWQGPNCPKVHRLKYWFSSWTHTEWTQLDWRPGASCLQLIGCRCLHESLALDGLPTGWLAVSQPWHYTQTLRGGLPHSLKSKISRRCT